MTRKTKKVGSTGRFGPRYGSQLKKRFLKVENSMNATHKCPSCASPRVKRKSVGIWNCKKCGLSFAGGAWIPVTPTGRTAARTTLSLEDQRLGKSRK
ncbi:MAG: 50S ribosomal protein L37ae [Candidatus Heimdallarchaeota archaeon]|nr:50S ribosomal protein L37ae [Candidatus Heimdallarchaeota archaeon]MBY8992928.1 50S ribosomal protein L37ae [Candidatus Heimdallarchaeota archaeon]